MGYECYRPVGCLYLLIFVFFKMIFRQISDFILRISGWQSFAVALAIYLVFGAYVMPHGLARISELSGHQAEILDLQFGGYSPERAREIISGYTDEARDYTARFELIADSLYPVVYTFLFLIMMGWLAKELAAYGRRLRWILLLPVVAMIVDYCENTCIIRLLHSYPDLPNGLVAWSSALTVTKWSMLGLEVVVIVTCLCILGYYRLSAKQKRPTPTG